MSLAGSDNQRNLQAIALLALFLSFSSFSFINLVTRPVACFPGDIGTIKCPYTGATNPTLQRGTQGTTIAAGQSFGTVTVNFSPAYAVAPSCIFGFYTTATAVSLSGYPMTFFTGSNSSQVLSDDTSQHSFTVPNIDTTLNSFTLVPSSASITLVTVHADGYATFSALSTNQVINIKLNVGGVQFGQTMTVDAAIGATSRVPWSITASFNGNAIGFGVIAVTAGAVAADANTRVFENDMSVSVTPSGIWENMPTTDSPTELFGQTNNEIFGQLSQFNAFQISVDVLDPSNNVSGTSTLAVQYLSSSTGLWTNLGSSSSWANINGAGVSLGAKTAFPSDNFLNGNYLRIVGRDGGGVGDVPQFGNIVVSFFFGTSQPVNVGQTTFTSVTTTQLKVKVTLIFASAPVGGQFVTIWYRCE